MIKVCAEEFLKLNYEKKRLASDGLFIYIGHQGLFLG